MSNSAFVYTTYIQTSASKLWSALTHPEFTRQYWVPGIVSDWTTGATWQHIEDGPDGKPRRNIHGEVLESTPPSRLVLSWKDAGLPGDDSRVSFEISELGDMVRLDVVHDGFMTGSQVAGRVSQGWPRVLSSLKSLLETGKPLDTWAGMVRSCGVHAA